MSFLKNLYDQTKRASIAAGTSLQTANCPSGSDNKACFAAFIGLHLTASSSAYLEVRVAHG
jgi:hypothetical protein